MGKKITANPKALEAREKKLEKKKSLDLELKKKKEDELWIETDKNIIKKLARKDEREEKRIAELQRKQQLKKLADEELANMAGKITIKSAPRVTKKQIEDKINLSGPVGNTIGVSGSSQISLSMQNDGLSKIARKSADTTPLNLSVDDVILDDIPENLNRTQDDIIHAKGVDAAIDVLNKLNLADTDTKACDRHPEKRVHAAYKLYEAKEMARLKEEYPQMKFSQMKENISKSWLRSPENPLYIHRINSTS